MPCVKELLNGTFFFFVLLLLLSSYRLLYTLIIDFHLVLFSTTTIPAHLYSSLSSASAEQTLSLPNNKKKSVVQNVVNGGISREEKRSCLCLEINTRFFTLGETEVHSAKFSPSGSWFPRVGIDFKFWFVFPLAAAVSF